MYTTTEGSKEVRANKTHEFISNLRDMNKLTRIYTQNIDRTINKMPSFWKCCVCLL